MLTKRIGLGLLLTGLLALGLSLNGLWQPAAASQEAQSEVTELHIHMGEFFFQVEGQPQEAPIEVEAGKTYVLKFHVDGRIKHEAMFGAELKQEDGMPHGYANNLLGDVELEIKGDMNGKEFEIEVMGLMEIELDADHLLEIELTLPESKKGEWEIGCFIPGHYEAGMKLPLIVK
jgi:uncharacterized cupredoxin-like copper-binding protein